MTSRNIQITPPTPQDYMSFLDKKFGTPWHLDRIFGKQGTQMPPPTVPSPLAIFLAQWYEVPRAMMLLALRVTGPFVAKPFGREDDPPGAEIVVYALPKWTINYVAYSDNVPFPAPAQLFQAKDHFHLFLHPSKGS